MDDIMISEHAVRRFVQRNYGRDLGKDPAKTLKKMLSRSKEIEYITYHKVLRLLNHGFTETKYYYHSGLIFVCALPNKVIVTVEEQGQRQLGQDFKFVGEGF